MFNHVSVPEPKWTGFTPNLSHSDDLSGSLLSIASFWKDFGKSLSQERDSTDQVNKAIHT